MKSRIIIAIVIVVALVLAMGAYSGWFRKDTSLQSSGTVEARNIRVGS